MNPSLQKSALALSLGAALVTTAACQKDEPRRPNILILIADDMGYSDIGAFGSEIETPNIDRLANEGMSLTNFHVGATCSPTRTMLISGVDNHLAGLGNMHEIMADNQFGQPGYEGHLNDSVVSIASVLRDGGYHTYMAGKWHLGGEPGSIPHARGFEKSFALAESGADNWVEMPYAPIYDRVHYFEDAELTSLPTEGYYSTDFYTQRIIDNIEADRGDGQPFLAWIGYQAVHYPHQAPKDFIDKYDGLYDRGWEAIRLERLERQQELGIVPVNTRLDTAFEKSGIPDWHLPDWDSLSPEEQKFNARRMQAYAGMLDCMDVNIGKLLAYLDDIGELDNTFILFMSDNGADPSQLANEEAYRPWYEANYPYTYIEDYEGDYSAMGQKGSYVDYGPGWAAAANTPNSYFKTFSTEGGLRAPFIARFPGQVPGNSTTNAFGYVKDVFPTLLELAGAQHPGASYRGREVHGPDGASAWPLLTGESDAIHASTEAIGYELAGSSAVFRGDFKLSRNPAPKGAGNWELYNIVEDPGETIDLAATMPELANELIQAYEAYESQYDVVPVPDDYNPGTQMLKNRQRQAGD
ncbi:MAG: arylsulfatase [Planctomycetota bacterium]